MSDLYVKSRPSNVSLCAGQSFNVRTGLDDMSSSTLDKLHEDSQVATHLASASRFKIQLARALVTDPEVLLIHKPIAFATAHEAHTIMELLREFVDKRGVENDTETKYFRRPRTCIISLAKPFCMNLVDKVVSMRERGIKELSAAELTEEVSVLQRGLQSACSEAESAEPHWGADCDSDAELSDGAAARCAEAVNDGAEGELPNGNGEHPGRLSL